MTKKYIKLLIALVIVAILSIGAYIGVTVYKNKEQKKLQEEAMKNVLFNYNVNDIVGLKIHNSSGDYAFEINSDDEWIMTDGDGIALNAAKLATISNTVCELTASSVLSENGSAELSKYGLDAPMIINAITKSGTENSLEIGKKVPGDSNYYVKKTGSSTIYLLSSDAVDKIWAERDELKDTYIFDVSDSKSVNYLKLVRDGKTVFDLSRDEEDEWNISKPYISKPVNAAQISSIVSEVIRSTCASIGEEKLTDLSKYGFDKPSYELEVKSDSKSVHMLFGGYYDEEEKYIYALNKELGQVYMFEKDSLGYLDTEVENILVKTIRNEYLGNIAGFSINIFGQPIEMKFTYDPATLKDTEYYIDGVKIDDSDDTVLNAYNFLLNAVTGIAFDKISENPDKSELEKEPAAFITYKFNDGTEYKIEFIETPDDENYFYMLEDGKYMGVLGRRNMLEGGILKYYNELKDLL